MKSTTFDTSFSNMFLDSVSDIETFAPLHALESYQEAKAAYSALHTEIFDNNHAADEKTVQAIMNAIHRIQDLEMQYIYRMGIQNGIHMSKPDFLIGGVTDE